MMFSYEKGDSMKRHGFHNFYFVFIILCNILFPNSCFAENISPVGLWKTIDDKTNTPRSIIRIWESNGELLGKIEKAFYRPGEGPTDVCKKCPGEFHNKLVLGLTIMWGLHQDPEDQYSWVNGKILDPTNGQIYNCQLTINEAGDELHVRGYLGVSLFGRTQVWLREQQNK